MLSVFVLKVKSHETDFLCTLKKLEFPLTNMGPQYTCHAFFNATILKYRIKSLYGLHAGKLSNDDVIQFLMDFTTSTYFPPNLSTFLPNLKLIAVRSSSVKYIERDNFKGVKSLEYLSLSDNKIKKIPSNAFMDLKSVIIINIRKNLLTSLDKDLFKNNILLEKLLLEANRITILESNMFDHLVNLNLLDFTDNLCLDKNYSGTAVRKIKKDVGKKCQVLGIPDATEPPSFSINFYEFKSIITIILMVIVLALFLELTYFVHKLKA